MSADLHLKLESLDQAPEGTPLVRWVPTIDAGAEALPR